MAVGVVLEFVGQNLLGTALILLTAWGAVGAARGRSRDAVPTSTRAALRAGRRPPD